ncbi:hypothetical protein [Kitasatospora sp. GP82]|uniref:hypothetical protein n=1 Tax=Kitasatospora sp. GP82 TaxID=3035089 RepID=UPI00247354C2|nr:hypothetical protein [Kitasatospora sp. GP82]MDH6130000.1 nitroreductase [Kitasatospora sp. GP82]
MTTDALSSRVLRYAFAQGTGRSSVALPTHPGDLPGLAGLLPPGASPEHRTRLPYGTTELLEGAAYPGGRCAQLPQAIDHALIAALGLQRAELCNPYFEHRAVPSVRSLFPVHAFLTGGGRRQVLDVHRHALVDLDRAGSPDEPRRVLLAGRYTRLPSFYGRLRGTLTELELGISLRSLAVAMELFGLSGQLSLPTSGALLEQLGLTPEGEWTWPLAVELDGPGSACPQRERAEAEVPDPVLAEVVAVNRAQAASVDGTPVELGPAIPAAAHGRPQSWAEVLWERSSGRMPRGLTGMSGRLRRVPQAALSDAGSWLGVPPPGELLRRVAGAVRVTAAVQATDGYQDGLYRAAGDRLELHRAAPGILTDLERHYGYRLAPGNGCDVRHASAVWFLSASQRRLVEEFGPGGWTLAQYVTGWLTQGLCLNAAAHGLYARPARAFDGMEAQRLLGLEPDESVLLAVISGTPRFTELPLDVRL